MKFLKILIKSKAYNRVFNENTGEIVDKTRKFTESLNLISYLSRPRITNGISKIKEMMNLGIYIDVDLIEYKKLSEKI